MKKRLLIVSLVVICLAVATSGTWAYFTSQGTAHNVITTGGIKIGVVETMLGGEDGEEIPYPDEPISGVMPATEHSKIVRVNNEENSASAWVRVKLTVGVKGADGADLDPAKILLNLCDGWTLGEDGYYYCNDKVEGGAMSAPVIDKVVFASDMGNEYQNSTVTVDVYAEAVQSANNGESAMEAIGWPVADDGVVEDESDEIVAEVK